MFGTITVRVRVRGCKYESYVRYISTYDKQHVYITCMQHEIHTTQKIQHKAGVLGEDLEALCRSLC